MTTPPRRWTGALLWILAVVLMLGTAVYQRLTGPTHPARGTVQVADQELAYRLIRSENTGTDAVVRIPDPGVPATLRWKRYRTDDPWTDVPMTAAEGSLLAPLPSQPPAGKLEYHLVLAAPGGAVSVPAHESVVIRFKGAVPATILVPHVAFMFFAVLVGIRTLLEVAAGRPGVRWMTWTTLVLVGVGGMILGPVVQLYAFGEAWTGVPFGWDLTDNKTLVMFLAWLGAVAFVRRQDPVPRDARLAVAAAAVIMLFVYLVPHSMFGSELDYEQVDQGVKPEDAIQTGRQADQ